MLSNCHVIYFIYFLSLVGILYHTEAQRSIKQNFASQTQARYEGSSDHMVAVGECFLTYLGGEVDLYCYSSILTYACGLIVVFDSSNSSLLVSFAALQTESQLFYDYMLLI